MGSSTSTLSTLRYCPTFNKASPSCNPSKSRVRLLTFTISTHSSHGLSGDGFVRNSEMTISPHSGGSAGIQSIVAPCVLTPFVHSCASSTMMSIGFPSGSGDSRFTTQYGLSQYASSSVSSCINWHFNSERGSISG